MSNVELHSGTMFITKENGIPMLLGNDVIATAEVDATTNEFAPIHFDKHKSAEFSCDIHDFDTSLLHQMLHNTYSNNYVVEYDIPIMTQARWHKNARIRKKWLKRYGMKPDTIKISAIAEMLSSDVVSDCSFIIKDMEYILRPDQKRRELRIER